MSRDEFNHTSIFFCQLSTLRLHFRSMKFVFCHGSICPLEPTMINASFRDTDLPDVSLIPLLERQIKFYVLLILQTPSLLCTAFM